MKFKFRADGEDLLIFVIFAFFLLYVVAIMVVNVHTFATEGHLSGINPFPAFSPEYIGSTLILFFLAVLGLFASVSSMFFDREKGIGITTNKKDKGYSRWAKDKEIKEELKCVPITAKNAKEAGVPLILNDKEMWVDNGEYHSLVIGATGSGKTQEKTSNMLRARGYQILLLNFRDPQNGNAWNPMSLPYQMFKSGNQDKAIELLDDLALNILYDDSNKNADPFWEKTSADYFSGVALGLFEDAKEEEININSISLATTVGEEKFGSSTYIKEYFNAKDPNSAASINASSTIMAPSETKGSILSVFKQKVKLFASRENLSEMLSHSDVDLESIGEKPTAVFIVIQDEKKTYHSLVTILLKQIYETLISVAQKHGGKLPVRTNFLLDEFANMPPLKDVTTMITAARSRLIRFTMIIQNFAQLDDVYGKEEAETIRGNCGNIIYLITTELKALEEISKMCGEEKSKKDDKTASTPLVTVSDLQRMKQFEVIILRMRKQPFRTKFTPYFKLNWGVKYGPAEYPNRKKVEVHTFDIKEFVKNQKKKKLLEMMNANDGNDSSGGRNSSLPAGMPPFGFPPSSMGGGSGFPSSSMGGGSGFPLPDFLTGGSMPKISNDNPNPFKPSTSSRSPFPDFETFKKEMEKNSPINPFSSSGPSSSPISHDIDIPSKKPSLHDDSPIQDATVLPDSNNNSNNNLDLGFDVDELVKKIDAKIAELEEEEKREKEKAEKQKQESINVDSETKESDSIEQVYDTASNLESKKEEVSVPDSNLNLDDDSEEDDDDFFDDFFDS